MRSLLERSRYAQIALSYTRPLPLRIWAGITAAYLLWILVLGEGNVGAEMAVLLVGGTFAAWFGAMVTAHAKEQLADPRAKLTPGYRGPHLVVAAAIFAAGVVGLTAIIVARWQAIDNLPGSYDVWFPGYLAMVLVMTTLLAWMGQLQTPAAIVIIMLAFTPVLFDDGRQFLSDVARGRAATAAMVLLGLSIAGLIALWWRLGVMHEEMAEYNRLMGPGFRLKVRMTGDPVFRRENAADTGRLESFVRQAKRLDKIDSIANASFWRRARHWRIVIGMGHTPMFIAIVLGLMMVTQMLWAMHDREMHFVYPAILSAIVPGCIAAGIWPRRWYVLGDESLRPASRRQFIREQGAAMALELTATWLWISAVSFAAGLLLSEAWSVRETIRKILLALPVLAGGQVLIFGMIVWILRYRAGWLVIVPLFLVVIVALPLMAFAVINAQRGGAGEAIFISLAIAGIGLLITFDAYRRWLVTEFD